MKPLQWRKLALGGVIALLLSALVGCSRAPSPRKQAEELSQWLAQQQLSSCQTFWKANGNPKQPDSPDGLTLGSPNVFAAIGTKPEDLTSLDLFWADKRTVRPLAKPLPVSLIISGRGLPRKEAREPISLASFPEQKLGRLRHTAIAVSEAAREDLKVTVVDFAPMAGDQSVLCRWFLVENTGTRSRRVRLSFQPATREEPKRLNRRGYRFGDALAIISDAPLRRRQERLEVAVGPVRPKQQKAVAVLLVGAGSSEKLTAYTRQARAALPKLLDLLKQTQADWEAWRAQASLTTGDEKMDDLLDALLCLVRTHIGAEAIHTGSLKYPHDRAWIRDSYWVQRVLLELGYRTEAKQNLDFFHKAWQTSGIASYYDIASKKSTAYGYHGVELPHYLILMVKDAECLGGVNGAAYWDMVRACQDEAAVPASGLQPMNGDETWLLAAPVRELDGLLDNSWLLIASAEYAADLAKRMGDPTRAASYEARAMCARRALERFVTQEGWFATGVGADGSQDASLCSEALARGAILGVLPATDPHLVTGLNASWQRLNYDRGIRSYTRSATLTGGAPGYVLWAASQQPSNKFMPELISRLPKLASATGCVWEFHDMYDPAWGGEKQRLWDSAVLLTGLTQALFTRTEVGGKVTFTPKKLTEAIPPPITPPFDGARLLSEAGAALIYQSKSPEHAARLALELTRQCNRTSAVAPYTGQPLNSSAIIVSRAAPPSSWKAMNGYWVREWSGPPQLWVRNGGHVFKDTEALVTDLTSWLKPEREQPGPFPDTNLELVSRLGEEPAGEASVAITSLFHRAQARLNLAGDKKTLRAGQTAVSTQAQPDQGRILKLTVSAPAHPSPLEVDVTMPAGYWLVVGRDMTGAWDRVRDPVGEYHLPDGRTRYTYSLRPNEQSFNLSFSFARLAVR